MASKSDILSDYYRMPKNKAGILADYDRMRRLANDRMRAIENKRTTSGLSGLTQFAYKRAVHDLQGATRFPTRNQIDKLNYNAVVKRMNDMRKFLKSETSTITGTRNLYKRNADKFNQKYGTNFTQSELAKFFDKNTGLYEKIKSDHPEWGSETIMKSIATIKNNQDKVLDKISQENDKHMDFDSSVKVEEVTNAIIDNMPDEVKGWLEG